MEEQELRQEIERTRQLKKNMKELLRYMRSKGFNDLEIAGAIATLTQAKLEPTTETIDRMNKIFRNQ